jgi:protein KRI1
VDEATILKLIEGDFDPQKFEELMGTAYGDDFYAQPDQEWKSDRDVRDALQHDEDGDLIVGQDTEDGGLYDNYDENDGEEEDVGAYVDEEAHDEEGEWYDEENDDHEFQEDQGETSIEKKVKSKLMEELYKLDYEDIVAGQPTRFKYRQVEPNNFGLTPEEILFARDSTLKQFVSLKKIAPYRDDEPFVGSRKRRRFREMLKHDMEEVLTETTEAASTTPTGEAEEEAQGDAEEEPKKKKKNRRLKKSKKNDEESNGDPATNQPAKRVKANGVKSASVPSRSSKEDKADANVNPSSPTNKDSAAKPSQDKGGEKLGGDDKREKKKSKKRKRKNKKSEVEGIPDSRLASYGL